MGQLPSGANRLAQKTQRFLRHAMFHAAGRGEAHGHETRQRYRLQIAAAVGLHSLQHAQARIDRRAPHQTCQWATRPAMHEARLSDRHECRNRVADHRQSCPTIEPLRHTRPLERQRRDLRPVDQSGQRAVGENRYGECLVGAVARAETVDAAFALQVGPGPIQWILVMSVLSGQVECGDDQHRRGNIRVALVRISPAAVVVLLRYQIGNPALDQPGIRRSRVRRV